MKPLDIIEKCLEEIAAYKAEAEAVKAQYDAAISEVEKTLGEKLNKIKQKIKEKEKILLKEAKAHAGEIFEKRDKREFAKGVLYYQVIEKVKRSRDVTVNKLKELGYTDGIKIIEKVDWESIEKWTDERLIAIGTERVKKEDIKYEVFVNLEAKNGNNRKS